MWYVFTEQFNKKWNRTERIVKCIGFFLVERQAQTEAKKHPFGYHRCGFRCSQDEQEAIKKAGWWDWRK